MKLPLSKIIFWNTLCLFMQLLSVFYAAVACHHLEYQFFINLSSKLLSIILLKYKKSNWFYFLCWHSLRSTQTIAVFSRQNTELFGWYILRSSHPELFYEKSVLKYFTKIGKHLCQSLVFNKGNLTQVLTCEFCEIFKNRYNTSGQLNLHIARHQHGEKFPLTQFIAHSFDLILITLEL